MSDSNGSCATEVTAALPAAVRGLSQQKMRRDNSCFERLRADWAKWRERRISSERSGAPGHNLIRLMRLERSEVKLHSPFLRDLLDPHGTHGQGGLFLRSFLRLLDQKLNEKGHRLAGNEFHSKVPDVPDEGDWIVRCEQEKIDVRVYSPKAWLLVFIENKIDADEKLRQIERQRELLDPYKGAYPHRLLVGLAPGGYEFSTGKPDIQLTYEDDISAWLTEAAQQISRGAIKLLGNICQYCEIVRNLSADGENMPNQELIDLITKPDNFQCALDVADAIDDLKNSLRRKFWRAVAESLKEGLANAAHATDWVIAGLDKACRNPDKQEIGVYLTAAGPAPNSGGLRIGVWQGWKGSSLLVFHGVGFRTEQPDLHPLQEKMGNLRDALPEEWKERKIDRWWIGWCWTSHDTKSRDFLFSTSRDVDTLARRTIDTVITVLSDQSLWRRIVEVDNALRG